MFTLMAVIMFKGVIYNIVLDTQMGEDYCIHQMEVGIGEGAKGFISPGVEVDITNAPLICLKEE